MQEDANNTEPDHPSEYFSRNVRPILFLRAQKIVLIHLALWEQTIYISAIRFHKSNVYSDNFQ